VMQGGGDLDQPLDDRSPWPFQHPPGLLPVLVSLEEGRPVERVPAELEVVVWRALNGHLQEASLATLDLGRQDVDPLDDGGPGQ
jgi:hypothetical protein